MATIHQISLPGLSRTIKILEWITIVAIGITFAMSGEVAQAQQSGTLPRIGYITGVDRSDSGGYIEAFRRGLGELGYIEGKNILIEYGSLDGKLDRIPSVVAELVQVKVDVLVLGNFRAIRAAKQATKTIPIVMVTTQDPVATGIIESLARPGANITGLTRLTRDLSGKRLEMLKEVLPTLSRIAILWNAREDAETSGSAIALKEYEAAAPALKLQLESLDVRGANPDFEGAFQAAAKARARALVTIHNALILRYPKQIADLAIKTRLPSIFEGNEYVEAGGLMSYSADSAERYRRAAVYVDRILKGAKPADLPVEQPTRFELVVNLKTAKQIGLTIPPTVLSRADKVIR
jgi:putative tryptophan/tyrosine transport system substrate-binding protein